MDLKEMGVDVMNWMKLAHDRVLVNVVFEP